MTSLRIFSLATDLRTVTSPQGTHTANSLVALSPSSLLITNDHLFAHRPPTQDSLIEALSPTFGSLASRLAPIVGKAPLCIILAKVETLLGLPMSWVAHVEWQNTKQVVVEGKVNDQAQQAIDFAMANQGVSTKIVAKGISVSWS